MNRRRQLLILAGLFVVLIGVGLVVYRSTSKTNTERVETAVADGEQISCVIPFETNEPDDSESTIYIGESAVRTTISIDGQPQDNLLFSDGTLYSWQTGSQAGTIEAVYNDGFSVDQYLDERPTVQALTEYPDAVCTDDFDQQVLQVPSGIEFSVNFGE